jgi:small neutral amino acid transporter SnatA (MarC family)
VAAAAIGLATMTMVTIGVMLGRVLGAVVGKRAEMVGGVVLMIVGATILYEHLSPDSARLSAASVIALPNAAPLAVLSKMHQTLAPSAAQSCMSCASCCR